MPLTSPLTRSLTAKLTRPFVGAGSSATGAYDADALAYFNAIEGVSGNFDNTAANPAATAAAVKLALNTLVVGVKAAVNWSKVDTFCPFIGGNVSSHSINLKDLTKNMIAVGASTNDSNGWTADGATGYLKLGQKAYTLLENDHGTGYGIGYDGSYLMYLGPFAGDSKRISSGCQTENNQGGVCYCNYFTFGTLGGSWDRTMKVAFASVSDAGIANNYFPSGQPNSYWGGFYAFTSAGNVGLTDWKLMKGATAYSPTSSPGTTGWSSQIARLQAMDFCLNATHGTWTGYSISTNPANWRFFFSTREPLSSGQLAAVKTLVTDFQTLIGRAG